MGYMDEYNKLKKKREEEENKSSADTLSARLAGGQSITALPSSTELLRKIVYDTEDAVLAKIKEGEKEKERTWFQKGVFEDGFQVLDIPRFILGTGLDAASDLGTGILGAGEKVVDFFAMVGNAQAQANLNESMNSELMLNAITGKGGETNSVVNRYGNMKNFYNQGTAEFVAKDLYDEEKVANTIVNGLTKPAQQMYKVDIEKDSVLGEKSDSLIQSAGQQVPNFLANLVLPGSGMALMAATTYGSEAENALRNGATLDEAMLSATISAGAEILTEKLGGISFGGKTLTDKAFEPLARKMTSKLTNALIVTGKIGADATAEGIEEIVSGYASALGQKLSYMDDKEIEELFSRDDMLESFIGGFVLGGVGESVGTVKDVASGKNPVSGLTKNEQAVANKVYESELAEKEKNGKLTSKEKNALYEDVVKRMKKGYIGTDIIESVLGGDFYNEYQSLLDEETSLMQEREELEKTPENQFTVGQRNRLNEINTRLGEIDTKTAKTNLFSEVDKLTANDMNLRESYNEKARRGQTFEADLTEYDEKAKPVIQKAIDSGILNNTRRTHEFVDMVAKISADKGVLFDFANNAKLKESGFAIDGKQVNGFVTKDGVTINVNSAKALNSVVGHEITHVLEGTDLYNELRTAITEYAKSKGDYQERYDALAELYKDIEGANIDAELTADLVGDYLFTDEDFVRSLSTKHRNVFQKIYDEIKYMLKVATAGSKEAKELEKVKRAFDKAYREGGKQSGDTKYSISELDNAYRYNVDNGDMELAQLYVEQAAHNAGYDIEAYHGTDSDFYTFSLENRGRHGEKLGVGYYFTNNKESAESYSNHTGKVKHCFLDIKKPISHEIMTISEKEWGKFLDYAQEHRDEYINGEWKGNNINKDFEVRDMLYFDNDAELIKTFIDVVAGRNSEVAEGYLKMLKDSIGYDGVKYENGNARVYVAFTPEQIKSADTVTYDENGDTIPLIERFNAESKDIRYSLSAEGEKQKQYGTYNVVGEDLQYAPVSPENATDTSAAKDIAHVAEDVTLARQEQNTADSQTLGNTMQDKLNGPLLMKDPLDQEVEKLYRMQQTNQIPDSAYFAELSKAEEAYAKAGRDFSEAFSRVVDAYQGEADTQATVENSYISLEDYANSESHVWRNVAYNDDATKASIMQATHDAMVAEGSVVAVTQDVLNTVEKSFPDLRSMKKKERTPILKEAINKLKNNIRQFLTDLSNQNFEFEVNGKVLDAKLYSTGINEVLEKVTQEKANMLYSTEEIFRNARYLYSTPDYDGDPNVYRWNYFYTPVQIGDETIGVRIAVRDVATPRESQIYNWGIKKDASLGGVGRGTNNRISHGASSDASANNIPKDVTGVKHSLDDSVAEDIEAPTQDDIMRMEAETELHGPWRMTDELDQRVEKLYRMMLREQISEEDYIAQLVKADRLYQQRGSKVEEALERVREAYSKETTETPETEKKMERLTRKVLHKGIMENIQEGLAKAGFDLNTILKNAKNLSTFATVDNTPQRVNEKTFGYKAGQIINDLTINKAALNESDGIKWLNGQVAKIKELSKRYGIKPGSKESRAAQIYGEGFWVNEVGEYIQYGDAELAADFPDTETQAKIKALAKSPEVRKMYDDALNAINEARVRNGYPAIPRLDNYFLHFRAQDDTFSKIGVPFNPNDIRAKDLPTDLNGVTADLKPGKPFFASEMHRTGDKTTYDLLGGLERYMNSAKNQIYHIDDIQTFRAMRNYIADMFGQANGLSDLDSLSPEEQEQRIKEVFDNHLSTYAKFLNEEANIFAGKTALIDRGVEGVLGRRAIQFLHDVNGQVGKNMVGWNVSSAGTNILPMVQATAKLPKADVVKAFAQTISNKFRSDGFVESDPALIRRKGADQFTKTPWQRLSDPGYALMSAVDNLSSELVVRAKYNELVRKGMDSQQAHIRAGEWAMRLMGDRSLGQMPQLYNSKTLGLITKFQLEVRNQLDAMGYDVVQEAKAEEGTSNGKKAAKVASTMAQLAIFQYLFGQAYESIAGYNPAFDIVENLIKLFGLDDDEESEDTFGDNLEQAFLGLLEDLPYTSTFTGGRVPIASAIPVKELITGKDSYGNEKNRLETIGEALPYYILPGGYGQIKKTWQGLSMFDDDLPVSGSYTKSGKLRFPVEDTFGNRLKAGLFGQYASKNARDYFDNNRSPLSEKQIEEYKELDIPISDYWKYRKDLSGYSKVEDKVDYIAGLDLPVRKKNILVNNVSNRKNPIDMENYDDYGSLDELDFAMKNPGKYAVSKAVGDYSAYKTYNTEIGNIKADTDANGKTVNGSRKTKVAKYIDGLDIDYGQKLIIFKMEYKSDHTYNREIVEYLDSRKDITWEEEKTILEELGFTVYSDGTITWD